MRSRAGSRNVGSSVLSILLLIAIAALAILVALQLRGDLPPRFDVSEPEGIDCPVGEGAPACFSFFVTNLGNEPSHVRCTVSVDVGRATFLNDTPIYVSSAPFEPGIMEMLTVKVDQGDAASVSQPTLVCEAF